jgi:hypothetical protein
MEETIEEDGKGNKARVAIGRRNGFSIMLEHFIQTSMGPRFQKALSALPRRNTISM